MVPEEERENVTARVRDILTGKQISAIEHRIRRKDGTLRWVSDTAILKKDAQGNLLSYDGVVKDITDIRAMESRARQSEKLEAIGALAGGIAHDFNNVLGGIIGYTEMSLDIVERDSPLEKNLRKILAASDRAKHLVRQILTFSRQSHQRKAIIRVVPIVKEVLELLKASIPSSIRIESDIKKLEKPILADPAEIHEMLLNLATNAVYAMAGKGTLTLRLYSSTIDHEVYGRSGKIPIGDYAVIEVGDTGSGMETQTLQKAFEPFFTTKPLGEGTGMGLSVVLGIVQLHGGDLQVETVSGKGTTFRIFLPASLEPGAQGRATDTSVRRGNGERILFVDDEKELTEVGHDILGTFGYAVTGISDSQEALDFLKKHASEIDILITDQTMPGMSGMELAQAALNINKDLPIILCTGYSNEAPAEKVAAIGIRQLIMKPYSSHDIRKSVRDLLDDKKSA
jgi:signal transduction histidine kinase/CheY-like chemotaxis protein